MNQVWLFFKLTEFCLGCICMYFHVIGSVYKAEPLKHMLVHCATFVSYAILALMGAIRVWLTKCSILSADLLVTLTAMLLHYVSGLLSMWSAKFDVHLEEFNTTQSYLEHPHFAHSKKQSIAAIITGTMYLMHMFHVLDLLMRMEPGDWRKQATGRLFNARGEYMAERSGDLYVLSKPVDDFLCRRCVCYDELAHSQPMRYKEDADKEARTFMSHMLDGIEHMWDWLFKVNPVESSESNLTTPSITTSTTSELHEFTTEKEPIMEDMGPEYGSRGTWSWRGPSDTTSLWAQIEDWSTPYPTSEPTVMPSRSSLKKQNNVEKKDHPPV